MRWIRVKGLFQMFSFLTTVRYYIQSFNFKRRLCSWITSSEIISLLIISSRILCRAPRKVNPIWNNLVTSAPPSSSLFTCIARYKNHWITATPCDVAYWYALPRRTRLLPFVIFIFMQYSLQVVCSLWFGRYSLNLEQHVDTSRFLITTQLHKFMHSKNEPNWDFEP